MLISTKLSIGESHFSETKKLQEGLGGTFANA
jgi:hypothetical protein